MADVGSVGITVDHAHERTARRRLLSWMAWSVPALPVTILAHELGHLFWLEFFGFPDVVLHYAAVSHGLHDRFWSFVRAGNLDAAAQVLSFTQIGLATATGIAISCATIAFSAFHTSTRTPHPFVVAVGLMATLRFRIGIQVMQRLLLTDNTIPSGTDEGLVSVVTGVPEMLLWAVGFAVVIAGWFFIVRRLPQGRRLKTFGAVVVGAAAGAAVYVLGLGPLLLP